MEKNCGTGLVPAKSTGTGPEPVPAQISPEPEPEFRSGPITYPFEIIKYHVLFVTYNVNQGSCAVLHLGLIGYAKMFTSSKEMTWIRYIALKQPKEQLVHQSIKEHISG